MAQRLFLERQTYRQNRLQDAARLLPILGLILLFGPIFIRDEAAGGGDGGLVEAPTLASGLVYYFAVWLGLIVLTAVVSRAMSRAAPSADAETMTPVAGLPPAAAAPSGSGEA